MLQHAQQKLSATQTFLQKHSLTNTETSHFSHSTHQLKLTERNSQQTLPESLPYHSRSFEFDQTNFPNYLEEQIEELQERYKGIHKLLIKHSQYESNLHERRRGYKVMEIDQTSLGKDFSNKLHIIEDIKSLVANIGSKNQLELDQLLQTKFQEYYLERHYGGLTCEVDNLSIQQRMDNSLELENQQGSGSHHIGNYQSLIPESKITYSEQFCQTQEIGYDVYVEIPKIIEVEIPVIIFKLVNRFGRQHQNDSAHSHISNIDDIITKFSKPYEELYSSHKPHQSHHITITTPQSLNPTSILIQSNIQHPPTQIELAYSDFPEEDKFKLPLDSYAQIQSFISNDSRSASQRSRPRTERQTPISNETIFITEKVFSKSLIQKFEQNQRALLEQNGQLKESVNNLKMQLKEIQHKYKELEMHNTRLANRLEEEIQQSQYFSEKLDQLNAQLLQEKIQCLTHLNDSKERKIQILTQEVNHKTNLLEELNKSAQELDARLKKQQEIIYARQEQITLLSRLLAQKQNELNELTHCQQDVIQKASQTEINLKREIQNLQRQKSEMKQSIREYKKRLESQGISLQYQQASEIQGIIQTQQHHFQLQLKEFNEKYDKILSAYQQQLNQMNSQLIDLQHKNQEKTQFINLQHQEALKRKKQREQDCKQFEALIQEYSNQLQIKDLEITSFKRDAQQFQKRGKEFASLENKIYQALGFLQSQLVTQREQKNKLAIKVLEMESFLKQQMQQKVQKQLEIQLHLIEQLTQELQAKLSENKELKTKAHQLQVQVKNMGQQYDKAAAVLTEQNNKLKKVNSKLKRYTLSLEEEIKLFCGVDQSDSLKNWAAQITQQRNYYLELAVEGCKCQNREAPLIC